MVNKWYWIYVFLLTVQFSLAEKWEGRYSETGTGWRGNFHFKPKENSCALSQDPDWAFTFYAEAGFRLRMKTSSLSHHDKHFKNHLQKVLTGDGKGDVLCGAQREVSPTQWLLSMAYLTPAERPSKRTRESDSCYLWGLGMPCALVFSLVCLVGWVLFCLLVGWLVVFCCFFLKKKIRDGAGSYLGSGTEGSPGHTCSSYGDKRIFFEVGLLLWVPLETTLVAEYCLFAKNPSAQDPGIISDYQNFWTTR